MRPALVHISISFYVEEIRQWLKKPSQIGVDTKFPLSYSVTNDIDQLVSEQLYFHRNANQFSRSIAGSQFIDEEVGEIKWDIVNRSALYVSLPAHNLIIGQFPIDEMLHLLGTGEVDSDNNIKDARGYAIDLDGSVEHCKQIFKTAGSRSLHYSNDLVSVFWGAPRSFESVVTYPKVEI